MAYIGKAPASGIRNRFIYTATAGQTTFSGSDDENRTLNYTDGHFTDVYLNGVKLDKSDYTATSGTSVVLDEGAAVDDILEVVAFDTFSVFNGEFSADVTVGGTLTASGNVDVTGDATVTGDLTASADATITGDLTVDTDTLYVDSANNRVGIGVTSNLGSALTIARNNSVGFMNAAGTAADQIIYGDSSSNLRFYTNATERMRVDSSGNVLIGATSTPSNDYGTKFLKSSTSSTILAVYRQAQNGNVAVWGRGGNTVGSVSVTASSTSYNTSSDYRLKENAVDISDGITRVKQLQPKRFNFIVDDSTTVDGFMAHEAQTVVPEAVTGTQDEVDDDGNPVYQGIDQAKLVPLLTAALQEAITKIEALETENADFETRIAALEAN